MNPYASFLGAKDPHEVIAATCNRLNDFVGALGPKVDVAPAPGKWSAREIVCHLADTELVFAFRLRQSLAEPLHVIQPFDQDKWAERYAIYDAASALEIFKAVREWNLKLIASLTSEEKLKKLTHPERGEMTLGVIVETMAGHDLNHLAQIEAIGATKPQP
jgi:uncharacterized damage-inducible protein DinB